MMSCEDKGSSSFSMLVIVNNNKLASIFDKCAFLIKLEIQKVGKEPSLAHLPPDYDEDGGGARVRARWIGKGTYEERVV